MGHYTHPSHTPHLSALGPEGDWRIRIRSHQTSGLHPELGGVGLERERQSVSALKVEAGKADLKLDPGS